MEYPLLFLNPEEATVLDALTEEILPGEEGSPGASEAGVVQYIDRSLAGFLRDLQPVYRAGLIALRELSGDLGFVGLDSEARRKIVAALAESPSFAGRFFRIVREHTVQGFFGDPAYGGNRDLAGWKLVGFPGAHWGYSAEQMRPGVDAREIPLLTIEDLYARIGGGR
ncbi:gluconate 2-dehydrogenase subunit 3 family protein [Amycolatopsis sp. FU40]|uniref:gluconate 2-dehydrogenase subunit 3 family protein n=1 Tax=Amycolatopsis sp. FU40 TaxID=2914159 RepID=UPI001F414FC5|nr:gluconate 2-dehydrogenase subunit 3 family protein [Amycolatopsis sp. FU40]UKD57032.1 gluconate 2-dehydrogenase subunit 3 family protein [Amycolatopsis sp. FU40]